MWLQTARQGQSFETAYEGRRLSVSPQPRSFTEDEGKHLITMFGSLIVAAPEPTAQESAPLVVVTDTLPVRAELDAPRRRGRPRKSGA